MQKSSARKARLRPAIGAAVRAGQHVGAAAFVLLFSCNALQTAVANGDTRTLPLLHLHTKEEATITYKRNGRYDEEALSKINHVLRDWRRNETVRIDVKVIDAVWELYRDTGATGPIEIICGYRAPATNAMLRGRGRGVAKFSQHTLGKAIDLNIPGVSLEKQREAAMRLHRGGVGYYPGSNFIHVDVASIRHWPRMSYDQLARVFPNGRTVHVPSNGRPLPGYQVALAEISRRGDAPSQTSIEAARAAGVEVAAAKPQRVVVASLFGGGRDVEEEEDAGRATRSAAAKNASRQTATAKVASAATEAPKREPRRTAAAAPAPSDKPLVTASADGFVPSARNAPAAPTADQRNADAASVAPWWPLREDGPSDRVPLELALSYAAEPDLRVSLWNAPGPLGSQPAQASTDEDEAGVIVDKGAVKLAKKSGARLTAGAESPTARASVRTPVPAVAGMRFDDPWLRAAIIAPSLQTSLTTTSYGEPDFSGLSALMREPTATLVMTFSRDPHYGLAGARFSGRAVAFLSTVTYQRTAALR